MEEVKINYKDLSKEEQFSFCRKLGDAVMEDYKQRAAEYEANKPPFCSAGHDQKQWCCTKCKDGFEIHSPRIPGWD